MIGKLEALSMNAWPSLVTVLYDGCIMRISNGYTKRANSVNAIYSDMNHIEDIVEHAESIYGKRNLPVVFKILGVKEYRELNEYLDTKGYSKVDPTNVMTVDLCKFNIPSDTKVCISESFSDEWFAAFVKMNKIGGNEETARKMLQNIVGSTYVASIIDNNRIVACGYGAVEGAYVGFFDIIVDESARGKGFGKSLMTGLMDRAKKDKIDYGYLQVVSNNRIARNMYTGLGFKDRYEYWYMKK